MIKTKALRKGMCIALTAPSGAVRDESVVPRYEAFLISRGYRVKVGKTCYSRHGYLAGTDEMRADELNALFADNEVDAIFCVRGGYGAARILDRLDYDGIRRNPKIFNGFSDITALHAAINRYSGLITFHGPNGDLASGKEGCDVSFRLLESMLSGECRNAELAGLTDEAASTLVEGKARGLLCGGNMTVIAHSLGTPYEPDFTNKILFLEDINEAVYRIDEMVTELRHAGVFERCSGVVFGTFTGCRNAYPDFAVPLEDVLREECERAGKPAFMNFRCGHVQPMHTLPMGAICEMDSEKKIIRICENPVE